MHLAGGLNQQKQWNLFSLSLDESSTQTTLTRSRRRALKRSFLTALNILGFKISSR